MQECEICGKYTNHLLKCQIDGSIMNVCSNCSKMGEIIIEPKQEIQNIVPKQDEENLFDLNSEDELSDNWNMNIGKNRQNAGLTIKQLAEKLNIKESIMRKIEHGDFVPNDSLKNKIKGFFKFKMGKKKADMAIDKLMGLLLAIIVLAIIVILIVFFFDNGKEMITDHVFSFIPGVEETTP